MRTRFHAIAVAAVVLVALTACGGSAQVASKGAIKIGVDLPEALPDGAATLNGVRFAVQRAGGSVGGWALVIDHRDDTRQGSPSADAGVENVRAMLGNGDVGMIGPYTSSVANAEIPIAAAQHFAMISPSTTQPCLTRATHDRIFRAMSVESRMTSSSLRHQSQAPHAARRYGSPKYSTSARCRHRMPDA